MDKFISFKVFLFIIGIQILPNLSHAQCSTPPTNDCDSAPLMCNFSEGSTFCCQNDASMNPTGCIPLCPSGGTPYSTNWWAFTASSGRIHLEIYVQNCSINGSGLRAGIWADCSCTESIACKAVCTNQHLINLTGNIIGCKTYYLFVDGCNGDVCDICFEPNWGGFPKLPNPFLLNGVADVCEGACQFKYSASSSAGCVPYYKWTMDGVDLNVDAPQVIFDFPDVGDFILCVEATIGDPNTGIICEMKGPVCKHIKVRPTKDLVAPKTLLCQEVLPYIWHNHAIVETGEYRYNYIDQTNCCEYDSVKEFIVLPEPDHPNAFHIGCDDVDIYRDILTKQIFRTCQPGTFIPLSKSTNPYRCDSAYYLYAVFLDYNAQFNEHCDSGKLILKPSIIDRTELCQTDHKLDQNFKYRWYLKSDSLRKTIDTSSSLILKSKDDYCLELNVRSQFGNQNKQCIFRFCEELDESIYYVYEICPKGEFVSVEGDTVEYIIDSVLHPMTTNQIWTIEGGQILTRENGKDTNQVQVIWDRFAAERFLCYQYISSCGESKKCCKEVKFISSLRDEVLKPEDINLVPNPVRHSFRLITKSDLKIKSLQLYDIKGRPIQTWAQNFSEEFDLSKFTNGIYHVRINTTQGAIHKKIVLIK